MTCIKKDGWTLKNFCEMKDAVKVCRMSFGAAVPTHTPLKVKTNLLGRSKDSPDNWKLIRLVSLILNDALLSYFEGCPSL